MSTILNDKVSAKDQVSTTVPAGELFLNKGDLFSLSLASITLDSNGRYIFNEDLIGEALREEERNAKISEVDAFKNPTMVNGKNALFEVSALLSKLKSEGMKGLVQEMKDRLKMEQESLKNMIAVLTFLAKYTAALTEFEKHPTKANLEALAKLLENQFPGDKSVKKTMDELLSKYHQYRARQEIWDHDNGVEKFINELFYGDKDKDAMKHFVALVEKDLAKLLGSNNIPLYTKFIKQGEKMFKEEIVSLTEQISEMILIESILSGNPKDLLFKVETLVESLQQMEVKLNDQQSSEQNSIAKENIRNQRALIENAKKAIKKLDEASKHHGLVGWIEDIGKSIAKVFHEAYKAIGDIGSDLVTHQWSKLKEDVVSDFKALTGYNMLMNDLRLLKKGKIAEALADIGMQVAMVAMGGGIGVLLLVALQGTPIMKDLDQAAKLVTNALGALAELSAGNLKAAKAQGEAILTNPQLQAVTQIAMVVMIIAAAVSGQFWLAGIMTVLLVATMVTTSNGKSLMQDLTDGIASGLVKEFGMSKEAAQIVADVLVVVVVTALTAGEGIAESLAESGENIAAESANGVEEESSSVLGRIGKAIGPRIGRTLMVASMMMQSTNLAMDIGKATHNKAAEWIIFALMEVLEVVMAVVGGAGMVQGEVSLIANKLKSAASKVIPKMIQFIDENPSYLTNVAQKMQGGAMTAQGLAEIGQGGNRILQGHFEQLLEEYRGELQVGDAIVKTYSEAVKANQNQLKEIMDQFKQLLQTDFKATSMASEGIAQALEQLA